MKIFKLTDLCRMNPAMVAAIGMLFLATPSIASDNEGIYVPLEVVVESCHLNPDKIGACEKGKGDPRIMIYRNNTELVYDSRLSHKYALGPDYSFNDNVRFKIGIADTVKIILADKDMLRDDVLICQEASDMNSIMEMLDGRHEKEGSWYQLRRRHSPGRYHIQLVSTSMGKDDIDSSTLFRSNNKREDAGFIQKEIRSYVTDKPDHLLRVLHNGKLIFTTGSEGTDCGAQKKWIDKSFEMQWNPGDRIEVGFYERDVLSNDIIFEKIDSTDNSIGLFTRNMAGGRSGSSSAIFAIIVGE